MRDRKSSNYRQTAAAKLGRPLRPGEDVDHLNENKLDDSPANLQVIPHGEHSSRTGSKGRRSLRALQRSLTMPKRREKLY